MPQEAYWESLFDIPFILDRLAINGSLVNVAELGCGYGTFTIPAAQRIAGTLFTFDIEPAMVERTLARTVGAAANNVTATARDVLNDGFGLPSETCDVCLLFNILHCPQPVQLLREARRIVRPGGRVLVIHWRSDISTPRGPSPAIRPRPEQIQAWARGALLEPADAIQLPPWHFGVALGK